MFTDSLTCTYGSGSYCVGGGGSGCPAIGYTTTNSSIDIGDRVVIRRGSQFASQCDSIGTVIEPIEDQWQCDKWFRVKFDNGYKNSYPELDLVVVFDTPKDGTLIKINNKSTMLKQISSAFKRILSPALQAQVKAGLRNGDLMLTDLGQNELLELLAVQHEEALTKIANEKIAEEKDTK